VKWIELSVETHPEAVDAVANVFQEHGTGGVAIEQPIRSHIEGEEDPEPIGHPLVKAYIPVNEKSAEVERTIEESLWHLQAFDLSPLGNLQRREVEEEDWADGWKQHFHPLQIGRVVVKPSWRDWEAADDELVVELDPGMAFGTGLHPTTRLMLEALQTRVQPNMRVLDLGTGSGILAIAAAMLRAKVTALDISDIAVEVARENVRKNRVSDRVRVDVGTIEAVVNKSFDLILANIIASVLVDIAQSLHSHLAPGGVVLASGIIEEKLDNVRAALTDAGLEIVEERRDEDWYLIAARRVS
jgi:ribosomal protein L11 methyltransferase